MSVQVSNQTSVCDLSALAKHREMNRYYLFQCCLTELVWTALHVIVLSL